VKGSVLYRTRLPVPIAAAVRKAGVRIAPAGGNGFLTRPFVSLSGLRPIAAGIARIPESMRDEAAHAFALGLTRARVGRAAPLRGIDQTTPETVPLDGALDRA
jgi:hypothetical protein